MIFLELVKYLCAGNWLKQIIFAIFRFNTHEHFVYFKVFFNGEWPQNSKQDQIYIRMW